MRTDLPGQLARRATAGYRVIACRLLELPRHSQRQGVGCKPEKSFTARRPIRQKKKTRQDRPGASSKRLSQQALSMHSGRWLDGQVFFQRQLRFDVHLPQRVQAAEADVEVAGGEDAEERQA